MKEKDMKKTETVKRIKKKEEPEWVVVLTVVVLIVIGIIITASSLNNRKEFDSKTVAFEYPATWVSDPGYSAQEQGKKGTAAAVKRIFFAQDRYEGELYATSLLVRAFDLPEEVDIEDPAGMARFIWIGLASGYSTKPGYTFLSSGETEVLETTSLRQDYGYVEVPDASKDSLPEVVYGIDLLVPATASGKVYVFTLRGEKQYQKHLEDIYRQLLSTLSISTIGGDA